MWRKIQLGFPPLPPQPAWPGSDQCVHKYSTRHNPPMSDGSSVQRVWQVRVLLSETETPDCCMKRSKTQRSRSGGPAQFKCSKVTRVWCFSTP